MVRGQPSGEFISVSGIGQDTRGYAAYFNIQTVSIRYPEFLKGYPLEGYRYPEDIQLVAVTLSTRWKKMKLHAYESGSTTDSRPTIDYCQPRLPNEQHSGLTRCTYLVPQESSRMSPQMLRILLLIINILMLQIKLQIAVLEAYLFLIIPLLSAFYYFLTSF